MKKKLHTFLTLLMIIVMTTGCIKEDLSNCDNVMICLNYTADGDENLLHEKISKIDLYVFDENERLVEKMTYDSNKLKAQNSVISFRYPYGKQYTLIALGNAFENTDVLNENGGKINEIFIQSSAFDQTETNLKHDDNYIGSKVIRTPEAEGMVTTDTVSFSSAHINLDMRIKGDGVISPSKSADCPYELSIENCNAQINALNTLSTDVKRTYQLDLTYSQDGNYYHTNNAAVFRMDNQGVIDETTCSHVIVFKNKLTDEVFRFSLLDFLNKASDIKSKVLLQEAVLPLEIHFSAGSVDLTIPDWEIEDTFPEWAD